MRKPSPKGKSGQERRACAGAKTIGAMSLDSGRAARLHRRVRTLDVQLGRGYSSLRRGCLEPEHELCSHNSSAVTSLSDCVLRCEHEVGCGAVGFWELDLHGEDAPNRRYGFCKLKSAACVATAQVGPCSAKAKHSELPPLQRHWCAFALVKAPPSTCAAEPNRILSVGLGAALLPPPLPQPQPAAEGAHGNLMDASMHLLGGGLNNMLMHIAQLMDDSGCCAIGGANTLILPKLDADPLAEYGVSTGTTTAWLELVRNSMFGADSSAKSERRQAWRARKARNAQLLRDKAPPLSFNDVFDFAHFASQMRPCRLLLERPRTAPAGATSATKLKSLRDGEWRATRTLGLLYSAIRPNARVQALVAQLVDSANLHAGPRWAAVHLAIERDWWWDSEICVPRRSQAFLRRCYSPSEVADIIRGSLAEQRATGTLMMVAHDKVASMGPPLCLSAFGNASFKLVLDARIPYTLRNAAEQFFAARAPAGFYGVTSSTFSKGVAAMRAARRSDRLSTFAYDCASWAMERRVWTPDKADISIAHLGFEALRTIEPRQHCRAAF